MENQYEMNQADTDKATQTTPDDIILLIQKAKEVQPAWNNLAYNERAAFLKKINKTLISRIDEIAQTISTHNGKTRVDAMASEIVPSIMALSYYLKNNST